MIALDFTFSHRKVKMWP